MSKTNSTTPELAWEHAVHDIPEAGLSARREAVPEELATLASALDLIACSTLQAEYTITPTLDGRYRVSGRLNAQIAQACVVTLDPIEATIEESFDVAFWPQQDMPTPESGAVDLDDEAEPEPIVAGQIAVGRVVFEHLAAALDPYPRKPGAVMDWQPAAAPGAGPGKPESPFAVLASLKTKS